MTFIWDILLLSVAIFLVAKMMPSIHIKSFWVAILVGLVYSTINFLIGWLLVLITLPLIYITFGLFKFVINGLLLWITDKLIDDFEIENLSSTLIAALLITVMDSLLKWVF